MTRRRTAKRLLVAIPYLIVYVLVLFPLVLIVAVVLGAADAAVHLLTGRSSGLTSYSGTLWDWIGGNARWSLTGSGQFRWTP